MLARLALVLAVALGASVVQARPGALCSGISPTAPIFDDTADLPPVLPNDGCH